jgi:hypothetical protein
MVGGEFQWGQRHGWTASRSTTSACRSRSSSTSRTSSEASHDQERTLRQPACAAIAAVGVSSPARRSRRSAAPNRRRGRQRLHAVQVAAGREERRLHPALAKVDPNLFGIALVTVDGKVYTAGDVKTEVSIQSISKVFTMAQVIQEQGLDAIEKRIGVDATGARFNSIIAVEGVKVVGTGAPR